MANTLNCLATISLILVVADGACNEFGLGDSTGEQCSIGFPPLSFVLPAPTTEERRQAVIPGINFTCNGTVTRWTVGATWRGDYTTFTELQIWRNVSGTQYMKVDSSNIIVGAGNVSQVYELDIPLVFQKGDIFGYFQPSKMSSQTNLYLEISEKATVFYNELSGGDTTPPNLFDLESAGIDTNYPLVTVETDPPNCGCGFMSADRVFAVLEEPQINGGRDTKEFDDQQILLPSFSLTCSGLIVKWIMRAEKWNSGRNEFPELQIWRPDEGSTYRKVNSTQITLTEENESEVYEYPLEVPLLFQPGDILGVLQPDKDFARVQVAYDDHGDSVYYVFSGTAENSVLDIGAADMTKTGTPLITLEIISNQVAATPTPSFPTSISTSTATIKGISTTSISMLEESATIDYTKTSIMGSTLVFGTTTTAVLMSSTAPGEQVDKTPGSSDAGGVGSGSVAEIVLGVAVVLLLVVITAIIILFVLRKKRGRFKHTVTGGVQNPSYGDVVAAKYVRNTDTAQVYPNFQEDTHLYAAPDTEQPYEMPLTKSMEAAGTLLGITVPTMDQREVYQEIDDIYLYPHIELQPVVRNGGIDSPDGEEREFFTESDIYWVPASNTAELYEQLSKYRFREIHRDQLRITEHLGSGEFGTVNKGVWEGSPDKSREVAIKLLQKGASEESQVKFLQEAALMGQFSHPNIVSLLGVVTLGEPVMIVMELMENGDLKENLISMRPIPGELPPHSLYQQLLDFCHQVAAGMTYLAEKSFVHRDLAARNILLSGNTCKIADFGMARDLEESTYYTSQGGKIPVKWTAPEALHYKKYSTASDVWSFGCLVYEIWSLGHKPFEKYTNSQVVNLVMTGWRLPPPPGCPKEIYRLIIHCWHPESSKRPQFAHLLQTLSRSEYELLNMPAEEGDQGHGQASVLGAPLDVSKNTFTYLQNTYTKL